MTNHKKLYDKSPSIKKDEDGKPGISKPTKADGEGMGTEGNPLPGSEGEMPIHDVQAEEHKSMHKRHQEETTSMHERHLKDIKEMHARHEKTSKKPEDKKEEN